MNISNFSPISTIVLFTGSRRAAVSVINDLVTDNRVQRTCAALKESGYEVILIGRSLRSSPPLPDWDIKSVRMRMLFTTGPLFYLFFNLRLFLRLLFTRADLYYANDLDTLLPNYLVSRIKGKPLIYDSHELFCDVPELQHSPFKRKVWQKLERFIVPKLKHCITVNASIASIMEKKYGVPFSLVRNIGVAPSGFTPKTRAELGLPVDKKIILLQGAGINVQRGAEELCEAMAYVSNAVLFIIGSGDVWKVLQEKQKQPALRDKIVLINRLPASELRHYTYNADLGVSIDKNTNPNYYNSLPNKVFDYINAGVPILATRLPEIERIVTEWKLGVFIDSHDPRHIADVIDRVLFSGQLNALKEQAQQASSAFNWEQEKRVLLRVIARAGEPVG